MVIRVERRNGSGRGIAEQRAGDRGSIHPRGNALRACVSWPPGGAPDFAPARATDAALAKSLVASPTALTQPCRASMRGSHAAAPSTLGLCVAWQGRAQSGQPPNNALELTKSAPSRNRGLRSSTRCWADVRGDNPGLWDGRSAQFCYNICASSCVARRLQKVSHIKQAPRHVSAYHRARDPAL